LNCPKISFLIFCKNENSVQAIFNKIYQDVNKTLRQKGAYQMTKGTAIYLLQSKDVYLTPKGRKMLYKMLSKENKRKVAQK